MFRRARIDLDMLRANTLALKPAADERETIADVRADAYGHGLLPIVRALVRCGVGSFLVSRAADVAALRAADIPCSPFVAPADAESGLSAPKSMMHRLGLGLYGLSDAGTAAPGVRPVLTLVGEVVQVKQVEAGRGVSYGYTYRTPVAGTLVLVALGFADGIPRVASNRASVSVGGIIARIAGRIAMDQFVVDIGQGSAKIGDEVVLFGDPADAVPTVMDWADVTGIPAEDILAGLGPRIERVYRPADAFEVVEGERSRS